MEGRDEVLEVKTPCLKLHWKFVIVQLLTSIQMSNDTSISKIVSPGVQLKNSADAVQLLRPSTIRQME